jgi:hypothetical protein
MFQVYSSTNKLGRLQDLALPHVIDKVLRDASKLSLRLGIDVYFYNFPGYREIKKCSSINFIDKEIKFFVTMDDRIAINGAECLSAILFPNEVTECFKEFQQMGLTIFKDKTGIYYFERDLLPYHFIKEHIVTFDDMSKWRLRDWIKYFDLWKRERPTLWEYIRSQRFHSLRIS